MAIDLRGTYGGLLPLDSATAFKNSDDTLGERNTLIMVGNRKRPLITKYTLLVNVDGGIMWLSTLILPDWTLYLYWRSVLELSAIRSASELSVRT